jgi:hypothetical protein
MSYWNHHKFKVFYGALVKNFALLGWTPNGRSKPSSYWIPLRHSDIDAEVLITQPIQDTNLPEPRSTAFAIDVRARLNQIDKAIETALEGTAHRAQNAPLLMRGAKLCTTHKTYLGTVVTFQNNLNEVELASDLTKMITGEILPVWNRLLVAHRLSLDAMLACGVSPSMAICKCLGRCLVDRNSLDAQEQRLLDELMKSSTLAQISNSSSAIADVTSIADVAK